MLEMFDLNYVRSRYEKIVKISYIYLTPLRDAKCALVFAARFSALNRAIFDYLINNHFKYTVFDYLINSQI